ncbi:unnamed protein product [Lupinus luteus]|uniref:FAS1 domain-containing protein n=1 Tax=Lupinus luteus TaxID=3873 RepID=A0AAV1WCB7_LUPLU
MENFNSFLRLILLFAAVLCCSSNVNTATEGFESSFTPSIHSAPPPTPPDHQQHSFFSQTALLPPILSQLGFNELATAAPLLSESTSAWTGPSTIFAPSDASIRTCFSCSIPNLLREHMVPEHRSGKPLHTPDANAANSSSIRVMLRDAMFRLRNNGFSIVALAMKVKYAHLVSLNNMTIFAVDDLSIFSGSHSYIDNVRFHIVPNRYLLIADLEKLPVGTPLPTLERGQPLMITTSGGGTTLAPMRINYVRIKSSDVIRNVRIVVHSVYLPFPHINPMAAAYDNIFGGGDASEGTESKPQEEGMCSTAADGHGGCGASPMTMPQVQVKPIAMAMVDIEDHHGL